MKRAKQKVLCGADVIAKNGLDLEGKCGLITNHTGVLRDLSSTIDMLKEKCNLTALFGPEHGVKFVVLDRPNPSLLRKNKKPLNGKSVHKSGIFID